MTKLKVQLGDRSYDIALAWDSITDELPRWARTLLPPGKTALLSDSDVAPLYGDSVRRALEDASLSVHGVTVPSGEKSKSLDSLARVHEDLLDGGLDRSSSLVALGGGVVGDLGGFAAATFMRGIPLDRKSVV